MSIEFQVLDSADYFEMLLKHLIRSEEVMRKAKEYGLSSEDFLASKEYGIQIYKLFADIALDIGVAPIDQHLFALQLKQKIAEGKLHENLLDQAVDLLIWIYSSGDITPNYFADNLRTFIKRRREERAKLEYSDDNDRLRSELNKINLVLQQKELSTQATIVHPFVQLLKKSIYNLICTGYNKIDLKMGGLGYGEFGLIIGYSGAGKTAFATSMATKVALLGKKVAYMSLEELTEDVSNRLYAQVFKIDYSSLHNGTGYLELEEKFNDINSISAEQRQLLVDNLCIFGLKEEAPLKPVQLLGLLEAKAEETGFIPDLVIIDQLQFLIPNEEIGDEQEWIKEKRVAADCDQMSHQKIKDKHFALWVLHQAKGKLKEVFTEEEIDGFKGIRHKPDTILGIGRKDRLSDDFNIFSLKARHTKNFSLPYRGRLEYMTFEEPPTVDLTASVGNTYQAPQQLPRTELSSSQVDTVRTQILGASNEPIIDQRGIPRPSIPAGQT